jgi:hypothetical protein
MPLLPILVGKDPMLNSRLAPSQIAALSASADC